MPVVHVEPAGFDIDVLEGETLMHAAERLGYHWPTVCHGRAICTACRIEVEVGIENVSPMEEGEREALVGIPGLWIHEGRDLRLACQVKLHGDVVVRKPGVRQVGHPEAMS